MSKLEMGDNPTIYGGQTVPDEKGRVEIPPERSIEGIAPTDVKGNPMKIQIETSYQFIKKNGKIYRVGKNGIEYPPISEKEYDRIKKERQEVRQDEDRDVGMTH